MKRFVVLTVCWWILIVSYVGAPCRLVGEIDYYTMALFACQRLEGLPVELPTLSLVLCLVLCIVLLPNSMLQVSAFRWNAMLHSIGVATLAICLLKPLVSSSTTFNTTFIESMEFIGIVTGRAAAVYLAVMLLVISRRSVLSEWHSLDYTETIAFHRLAGWWVLVMSLLHSLAFAAFYLQRGGWHELLEATIPVALSSCKDPEDPLCWNTLGLVNGFGVVATFAVSILAILSREQVRRSAYNLFYFAHVALSFLFILFCGLHDFPMVILMFPGLAFYMKDRIVAFITRQELSDVTAEVLCRTGTSNVILLTWNTTPELKFMPGTRWVYLHERGVSRMQWHPYSVVQNGHRAQVLLKGAGDWSESLCKQVSQEALKLRIEGPYGKPMAQSSTLPPRNLLLVAGGVGISPFVDLLSGLQWLEAGWQQLHLVWAVRGDEFGGISGAIDWRRLCERAEVSVFVTSGEAESPSGMVDHRMGSNSQVAAARSGEMCRHRLLILSFVCITMGAVAADFLVHNWSIWVRHTVRSLLAWASLARCVPLLLVLLVLLAVTLLNFAVQRLSGKSRWGRFQDDSSPGMREEGGEGPEPKLCIQHAKPDLQQLVEQKAELGPVEVKVCGPQRMLATISATVLQLKKRGLTVELDSLESSL
ncbi:FRO6 [Symbiodinium sp. CCMP2456]|nr:FRO6 [Symbiodinium sp. CCMP2456]